MKKNILIIGGTGFLGTFLIEEALNHGYNISVFVRGVTTPKMSIAGNVEMIFGNRNNEEDVNNIFLGDRVFDAVFDLNGYFPKQIQLLINNKIKIKHYIFCSTAAVYNRSNWDLTFYENSPTIEDFLEDPYGFQKAECEQLLLKEWSDSNWPITIFRENRIYGPYEPWHFQYLHHRLINNLPIFVFANSTLENTNPIFVKDVIKAFMLSVDHDVSYGKIYNLGGPNYIGQLELIKECASILNKKAIIHEINDLDEATIEQKGVGDLNGWHPCLNTDLVKKDLGFEPSKFSDTVTETLDWVLVNIPTRKYKAVLEHIILDQYPPRIIGQLGSSFLDIMRRLKIKFK